MCQMEESNTVSQDNISGPNAVSYGMSLQINFSGLWKINVNILAKVCKRLWLCIMYNFCPFMAERNTTVCHIDFSILHAKCYIGVSMGFRRKSCLAQCLLSWKELIAHPHPSPMGKSHVKHFFFSFFPLPPCSGKVSSHVARKAKALRDALPANKCWSWPGSCQSSCCSPCLTCSCRYRTQWTI